MSGFATSLCFYHDNDGDIRLLSRKEFPPEDNCPACQAEIARVKKLTEEYEKMMKNRIPS